MTELAFNADGTYTKTINADDAETALVDALADLMHVHVAKGANPDLIAAELAVAFHNAVGSAEMHFEAEVAGDGGVRIEVLNGDGTKMTTEEAA